MKTTNLQIPTHTTVYAVDQGSQTQIAPWAKWGLVR